MPEPVPATFPRRPSAPLPAAAPAGPLVDAFGRVATSLRISVTDRCNYRCVYCMPAEGVPFVPKAEVLTYEELLRLVRVLAALGVRKVRVTGGEPLLRRDLPRFIAALRGVPGIQEISLTTNGFYLREMAGDLYRSGLRRLNVSLDTLRPERYREINRVDGLEKVLRGLEAAEAAGFAPIKVNAVLLPGLNEDEILEFARLARTRPIVVRFIEFMPMDGGALWSTDKVVSGGAVRERISRIYALEPVPGADPHAPARAYRFRDGRGEMGFINPMSEPFCDQCDRVRLSATGEFRTCMFQARGVDLRRPLREGADDAALAARFMDAVRRKERGGCLDIRDGVYSSPVRLSMSQIGG